jgi:hypothetical protein
MGDTKGMNDISRKPRHADSKGRITLGERFANRTVLVEAVGDDLLIRLARVVPESAVGASMHVEPAHAQPAPVDTPDAD